MKRKILSLILVFAMTVSLLTVGTGAVEPTYGDTAGHWAESSIERWSAYGIIQGSNGQFDPNGQLTCAQLATILAKLLKLPAAKDAGFTDNTADAWYYDAINRCAAAGILNGNGDGTVTPEAPITRERAMVMLARALGIEPIRKPDLTKYTDAAQVSAYAQGYVAALIEAGIVGGVTADELAPQDNINRASTVTILDRAISTYADKAGATVKADGKGLVLVVAENVKITGAPEGTKIVVADGATVTLVKNAEEDITVSGGKALAIDLNGMKLTNKSGDTIVVEIGATLTVTGSGTVDNVTHGKAAIYNNGTVILNGGSYTRSAEASTSIKDANGNSYYNILNHGTMTIGKNVSVTSRGSFSSLIANGYYSFSDPNPRSGHVSGTNQETPSLTINGGTFSGGINTIKNDDNATLTVNNGSFSNMTQAAIQNNHVATINGGTFDAKANHAIENRHFDGGHNTGSVTVTSGTFTGGLYTTTGATWSISGGTFSSDPSVYVVGNGSANIVKRAGSEGAYTYTVLAKSGLTSGVYLTNPSGALASNYYVSSTANGVWTVSYSAPSSGGGSSSSSRRYDVSAPSVKHGDVTVSPKNASKGDTVTITVKPDSGYELDTLTVKDASGSKIKVKDKGDGKFTFTMPASKVTVSAEFAEIETLDFADVSTDAYYYEAVKWAAKKGITGGIGNGLFGPNQPCTRAQIVTFLWRAAGSPEPKSMSSFSDVSADSYYAKAVAWAVENGITTGTGDGKFSPDATCTRAQSVTFLFRAIGKLVDSKAEFSDVLTDSYYANAVAWAMENGVTNGIGDGLFGPDNSCTRAQIVTFLFRAYQGK